jgi:hypothetical protein
MDTPFSKLSAWRDIKRQALLNAQSGKSLNPTQDAVFKLLFASPDPDSKEALRAPVSDCIHRPVRDIFAKNSETLPGYPGGKLFRLDIHAAFNGGEEADIEIQAQKTDDNLIARSLVCAGRLLGDQLKRGNKYLEVKRVYQIIFMDFTLFPESALVPGRYSFMEQREHSRLSDLAELIYYEMPKLKPAVKDFLENRGSIESLPSEEKRRIFFKYKQYEEMRPLYRGNMPGGRRDYAGEQKDRQTEPAEREVGAGRSWPVKNRAIYSVYCINALYKTFLIALYLSTYLQYFRLSNFYC